MDSLKTTVNQEISGKYLWLFPKTNILIYPQNAIASELQNKYKRLKNINLSIIDSKVLVITVTERNAEYLWCGMKPEKFTSQNISDQKCYFLDENGYFFDAAPYFSDEVYFKFYGLPEQVSNEVDNPMGQNFSKQNFEQLVIFKNAIISMGLKPVYLYALNNKDAEIILTQGKNASIEPKIIFNLNSNLQSITENLKAALDTEPLKTKILDKYSSLEYIDLRFENKVYDKFI